MKKLVVLISGKQGSGKTTLASQLHSKLNSNTIRTHHTTFAAPLYEMHHAVLDVLRCRGIKTPTKDGALLQLLGTEWGRNQYGEDIWVNLVKGEIEMRDDTVFIVSDCRFPNEVLSFRDAISIRLECPERIRRERILKTPGQNWRNNSDHASETALDKFEGWTIRACTETHSATQVLDRVFREIMFTLKMSS